MDRLYQVGEYLQNKRRSTVQWTAGKYNEYYRDYNKDYWEKDAQRRVHERKRRKTEQTAIANRKRKLEEEERGGRGGMARRFKKRKLGNTSTSKASKATRAARSKKFTKRRGPYAKRRFTKKRGYNRTVGKGFRNAVEKVINSNNPYKISIGTAPFDTNGSYITYSGTANGAPSGQGAYGYFSMECGTLFLNDASPANNMQFSPFAPIQNVVSPAVAAVCSTWADTMKTDWAWTTNLKTKIEIAWMKLKGTMTNVTNIPITVKIYKCKWRQDEGSPDVVTLAACWSKYGLSATYDNLTQNYSITPYDSPSFTSNIRILKARTIRLGAGESTVIKCKAGFNPYTYYTLNHLFQQPVNKKWTVGYLIFHHGALAHDVTAANVGAVTTAPSRLIVTWEGKIKSRSGQGNFANNVYLHNNTLSGITSGNLETGVGNANNPTIVDTN